MNFSIANISACLTRCVLGAWIASIGSHTASAQVPPESILELVYARQGQPSDDLYLIRHQLNPSGVTWETARWTPAATGMRSDGPLRIDPSTGRIWTLWRTHTPTQDFEVYEVVPDPSTMTWSKGASYTIPECCSFALSPVDDNSAVYLYSNSPRIIKLDLNTGQWRGVRLQFDDLYAYYPACGDRPAIASGREVGGTREVVASVDEQGAILNVFAQSPFAYPGYVVSLHTIPLGRSFACRWVTDPSIPPPAAPFRFEFWELDWNAHRMVDRNLIPGTLQRMVGLYGHSWWDPSRQLMYAVGGFNALNSTGAIFDLQTNTFVNPFDARRANGLLLVPMNYWNPVDVAVVSPRSPSIGASFTAHISTGGNPGDPALIWLEEAVLGGIPIPGIHSPILFGTTDQTGLLKISLPFDTSLYDLHSGDSLSFRGFRFDGQQVREALPAQIVWHPTL